jgi:hypothetical protein
MERTLIVVAQPGSGLRARRGEIDSVEGVDVTPLAELLASEGVTLRPLFGASEGRLRAETDSLAASTDIEVPNTSLYYRVEAPDDRLEDLAARFRAQDVVEAAYIKPRPALPQILNAMEPRGEEPPISTPDFTARQGYLNSAPSGIDARYAWTQTGGHGAGVGIIDIEGAWRFTHEDLRRNQGGVVGGTESADLDERNHGTAVVGVFGGDRNAFGVTGICADANVRAISSTGDLTLSEAIRHAANMLNPGDIILTEVHYPGPRFGFQEREDQHGYIAVEWWPDDYDAIRYALGRGVIVVEAAGNGAEDLDDGIYDVDPGPPDGPFPSWWRNPFKRNPLDSGAILVGAGAPPPGTHGRDHGPDRSRLEFSNWGALIDAQGWGEEVTTTGYGDLQGDKDEVTEDEWYTDEFSGTSSASPIVVGALACVQGILRARGDTPLTPTKARELLRATGSRQEDASGRPLVQRIGTRPDLRQLVARANEA